jgi:hypothetical protein
MEVNLRAKHYNLGDEWVFTAQKMKVELIFK